MSRMSTSTHRNF